MLSLFHSWQVLLTISILGAGFSTIIQKLLVRNTKVDTVAYSFFFQVVTGLVILMYAFVSGFTMPNLLLFPLNTLIMISFYAIANILVFKSVQLIDASEFTIFFMTRAVWTILAALLFLGEKFVLSQVIGTMCVALGVIIVSYKKNKFHFNKGSWYALLAGVFFGLAFANDAFLVRHYDVASYVSIAFILPGFAILLYSPKVLTNLKPLFSPSTFLKLILLSTIYAVAAVTMYLAYKVGSNAAQLGAINQVTTVVTVILAIIFLKETSNLWKKLLGAIIAFIGVVLIG